MSRRDDDTTLRDAALLGGGAVAAYVLLSRLGFGGGDFGGGSSGPSKGSGPAAAPSAAASPPRPFCDVFIRGDRYELEGVPSDIATAVAACRVAGGAYIRASGDTRQGSLDQLIRLLLENGVSWFGGPSGLLDDVNRVRATMPARRS